MPLSLRSPSDWELLSDSTLSEIQQCVGARDLRPAASSRVILRDVQLAKAPSRQTLGRLLQLTLRTGSSIRRLL